MKLNKQTPNCMVYGESGRKPLYIKIRLRMINFWIKIVTGDEHKLVFHFYKLLRKMHDDNYYTSPWIGKMEEIFNTCDMQNVWLNPLNFNTEWIRKEISLRLNDIFYQKWQLDIREMKSCSTYKLFKNYLKLEAYLLKLDSTDRINLCKFRCRNSKIPVIVLGYSIQNIPYENRLCTICDLNEIGDEYHYIMKCIFFLNSRQRYIKNNIWLNPNYSKFSDLFLSKDIIILRNLAKFVREINIKFL